MLKSRELIKDKEEIFKIGFLKFCMLVYCSNHQFEKMASDFDTSIFNKKTYLKLSNFKPQVTVFFNLQHNH